MSDKSNQSELQTYLGYAKALLSRENAIALFSVGVNIILLIFEQLTLMVYLTILVVFLNAAFNRQKSEMAEKILENNLFKFASQYLMDIPEKAAQFMAHMKEKYWEKSN